MKAYNRYFILIIGILLIICLLPFSSLAASSVSEEIPVDWYAKDPYDKTAYCSQQIYYYRSGGSSQYPIHWQSIRSSGTDNYTRFFGLLTQSKAAYVPPTSVSDLGIPLTSSYFKGGHDIYPDFRYIQLAYPEYDNLSCSFNMSTSEFGNSDYYVSYVGTAQRYHPTWKSYLDSFEYSSHDDYIHYGYSVSRPSMVCLRLFADIPISTFFDPENEYLNFAYDYSSYFPKFNSWFNTKRDELLSETDHYTACVGYVRAGVFYKLKYADSQYTYVTETERISNDINTTQTIRCNLYDLLDIYNEGLNEPLSLDQFIDTVPTLTVAITYWHIVYDRVMALDEEAIMSSQYFCRYALPVVYLSNYNPVTVGFAQVGQQLDQINNTLFVVQDAGDVQIIDNLRDKLDQSSDVVSGFDSAVAALDSIIGSVKPETNVIVNAFDTGDGATGAGAIFTNGIDLKSFFSGEYILPLFLIAISVSVISWVIYGKRSG